MALINDEREFGITVHFVDEGIDTGDIILQRVFPITDNDDYKTLLETAIYCVQRKEGDEIIDWNQTSREIFNFIRSICKPGPMARSFIADKEIKINKACYDKRCSFI